MDETWEGGKGSDDVTFGVGTGYSPDGIEGRVEVWAGGEMDAAWLTPEAARKAADEWPAILRRLADEADRPRCIHGKYEAHYCEGWISTVNPPRFGQIHCPGPTPKEA